MTREQATPEAARKRRAHPDAKWIATRRGAVWAVARIGVSPGSTEPTGTATKPPPPTPHEAPQSQRERLITLYGTGG